MKIDSLVIHGGISSDKATGAVNVPVYLSSTFKQPEFGVNLGYEYARTGNPTRESVEKLISDLEGGVRGFAFASGMAATSTVLNLFKSGDRILINNNLYGGTFRVIDKVFSNFGLKYDIVEDFNTFDFSTISEDVKGVFIETPTNPLLSITDIKRVAEEAKKRNLTVIVDNTFMTPYFQNPLSLGADIVVHSATKYLGGHSDVVAGLAVTNNTEIAERLAFLQNSIGAVLPPFDSYLLVRGIKTLSVRLDKHADNAQKIAEYLKAHEAIEEVFYPGLKDHPGHEIQKAQARGFGGVVSFKLKEGYDFKKFINSLELITFGESLGGIESLLCHPASMTHAALPVELRERIGIKDNLLRISVGIENFEDLRDEIEQAIINSKEEK
ncbi:trans-sulfuration enzyme family protein [Clostridium sp. 'White wine YQ']|uniref:trans-sulfuration enzyme family protein n=1 Tax=Clostridium sp. 'White wine YQ' TaxID=3027474 RepID=UPI002366CF2A|nr:PLP-dependent aspartate aminotransferase family protein [Clostridium sp. 'White wine YQ']MDD7792874.1 PLP-dependent aspartate aminotransferase family protein [Clostridium sp. 'White wine YQ']